MAIHTKVGILSQIPGASASVTPGLIDGLYADFLTKEFDFLDDSLMYPQDEWFTADPMTYIGTNSWEDLETTYWQWRDNRNSPEVNYWNSRRTRVPFVYQNFVQDPASYSNNGNGSSSIEFIRLVYPSPSGEFNIPYPNPRGSEHHPRYNPSKPLKHNMTRISLPLEDLYYAYAYQTGMVECLYPYFIKDNQAAIDAKQAERDAITAEWIPVDELVSTKEQEKQNLIDSGADQSLIDSLAAELAILYAQQDAFAEARSSVDAELSSLNEASQNIYNPLNKFTPHRANRDELFKELNEMAIARERGVSKKWDNTLGLWRDYTEEELARIEYLRTDHLSFDYSLENPNPFSDEIYRFAWGDGVNPNGGGNFTIHSVSSGDNINLSTLTNHPEGTMPFEVLQGVYKLNVLPAAKSISLLPATGMAGDIIKVYDGMNDGYPQYIDYAWDPQNQEWSTGFYYRFLGPILNNASTDAKTFRKSELILAMNPFTFAALHIPTFSLSTNGKIVK